MTLDDRPSIQPFSMFEAEKRKNKLSDDGNMNNRSTTWLPIKKNRHKNKKC